MISNKNVNINSSESINIGFFSKVGSFVTSAAIAPVLFPVGVYKVIEKSLPLLSGKEVDKKKIESSALMMVPLVGPLLSSHVLNSGSIEGFDNHSIIQKIIFDYIYDIPATIYNVPTRKEGNGFKQQMRSAYISHYKDEEMDEKSSRQMQDYLANPTVEKYLEIAKNELLPSVHRSFVKVKSIDGRIHDARLRLAEGNSFDSPTIVLYHGNGGGPDIFSNEECQFYHDMGYNVFIPSYAGDPVHLNSEADNSCSEDKLIYDAMADLAFLKTLGCRVISVYGYSLGGAQAMNLMKLIDDDIEVRFIILDKTFTSGYKVASRNIENEYYFPLLPTIIRAAAKEQFALEQQKNKLGDGLNNKRKLLEIAKKKPFKNTSLILFSSKVDEFAGGKNIFGSYIPKYNMSFQLQKEAINAGFKSVHNLMNPNGKHSTSIWGSTNVMLFDEKGKETTIKSINKYVEELIKLKQETQVQDKQLEELIVKMEQL